MGPDKSGAQEQGMGGMEGGEWSAGHSHQSLSASSSQGDSGGTQLEGTAVLHWAEPHPHTAATHCLWQALHTRTYVRTLLSCRLFLSVAQSLPVHWGMLMHEWMNGWMNEAFTQHWSLESVWMCIRTSCRDFELKTQSKPFLFFFYLTFYQYGGDTHEENPNKSVNWTSIAEDFFLNEWMN